MTTRSLDALEKLAYDPGVAPLELPGRPVALTPLEGVPTAAGRTLRLDGDWDLIQDGDADRVYSSWEGAFPARVPGGVHAALWENGWIPDPTVGKNDEAAREKSRHFWWYRKTFRHPGFERTRLVFGGVCDRCTVWLNGRLLGSHQGMFGGPEYEVTELLKEENVLLVMLYPAPYRVGRPYGELNPFFDHMNTGWVETTVFNCVYGWHYANIPALGIWRSVTLEEIPETEIIAPFAAAKSLDGTVELSVALSGGEGGFTGVLRGAVEPENFKGEAYGFETQVNAIRSRHEEKISFRLPDPKLWWPNGLGEQNLYRLTLTFMQEHEATDQKALVFAIRTVEMRPVNGEAKEDTYNWQFVVNGKPLFIKGSNWCTIDFAMRFTPEKYRRFLTLARAQHLQLLRAWGGGMPETDEFYDLCDQYGILVLQEFATAWDSQKVQPAEVLREGVKRTILRLRNHPSLALWGGGNESDHPTDAVIDMMGRMAYELDGTRVFHRSDPWGGSSHNYDVYWGQAELEKNLAYQAPFIGEFGFASSPNVESVRKYLPKEEWNVWPPEKDGSVAYHTPVFNQNKDLEILHRYIPEFLPDESVENMVASTQLCQATALRHTLELARTRYPKASGICYYKLTDVFPAVSWSTVDWYGVPKSSYYFVRDSFAPLHACVLFQELNPQGKEQKLPVYLLDDAGRLKGDWKVSCRAYGGGLTLLKEQAFEGTGQVGPVRRLGAFELTREHTENVPLLVVVELTADGARVGRTFYWLNFQAKCGALFQLPKTSLRLERKPGKALVTNTGGKPAVGVHFLCEAVSDQFTPEKNFFWLEPGETEEIAVDREDYDGIAAWNTEE